MSNKHSVLILANNDGGLYQFRKELIERLSSKYDVFCSVPAEDGYIELLENLGCRCIITKFDRRGTNPIRDYKLLKTYKQIIKDVDPSVVLTYTIKPNIYGGIACQTVKKPYIANITGLGTAIENGGLLSRVVLLLYRIGLRKANCVFFQNQSNSQIFTRKKVIKSKQRIIPGSGVNIDTHKLEDYPLDEGTFRFLFVGRIMKDKGIEELLTAMKMLINENINASLDVVGGCDEDYTKTLSEYEAEGYIKYHGQSKNVHSFYKNADCVVLPSYHEGMANVMLEAASTGRPVITTNIPGCRETFDEGLSGIGCEPKDTTGLFIAMKKMTEIPWADRKLMGLNGRKKVEQEFNREIIINAYAEEITRAI